MSASLPRRLVPQAISAADTRQRQGLWSRFPPLLTPKPGMLRVQLELQEREETVERETIGWSSGKLWSASLGPSEEADTARSASLPDAGRRPAEHPEPLPTTVLEGAQSSDSSMAVPSVVVASETPVFPSVCKEGEREEPANARPESSTRAVGETPSLQDPGEMSWEQFSYSQILATIHRICEEARIEMMFSSGKTSRPRSVSMPRLLTLHAADHSASAADAPQGMLGNCATRPKAEGQVPAHPC
ncbi:hypothetical protein ASZ78_012240 [Callipepla squamata]|uniref:Uncharacterized protein n=1 Tax=Callipepla squamata TaxID=9009 RepID=A0A226MAI4_CALSU|nr:hypothetical protein ASZ78_012240 [Callipepla squamata]